MIVTCQDTIVQCDTAHVKIRAENTMPTAITYCKVENCETRCAGRGYCMRHYKQFTRHGKIFTTIYEPRPAIIEGDIAKIPLGVNAKDGYAIVDKEFAHLAKRPWALSAVGYAACTTSSELLYIHRVITDCPSDKVVDHINHDKLDNRLANLRICTRAENVRNQVKKGSRLTDYKGVSLSGKKYRAKIKYNYKSIELGMYDTAEQAALAYNKKAAELHGAFAHLNIIKETT